jgi:DNA ligase-1
MKRFAALYRALDEASGTLEKTALIERYLRSVSTHDAAWGVYILLEKRKPILSPATLRARCVELCAIAPWLMDECREHVGDTAETVALLLKSCAMCAPNSTHAEREASASTDPTRESEQSLWQWMEQLLVKLSKKDEELQRTLLKHWWSQLSSDDCYVLNKILTGAMRVGVSEGLVLRALSNALSVDQAVVQHGLTGDWTPSAGLFARLQGKEGSVDPSKPYPFQLAHPLESGVIEDVTQWQVEHKWDGIRAQFIKRNGEIFIWSRGEELVTQQFVELHPELHRLADGTVLDGELIVWDTATSTPAPFALLQTRLQRKKVTASLIATAPTRVIAYDLLELDGVDLRSLPLRARRERLEHLLDNLSLDLISLSPTLTAPDVASLEVLRSGARIAGAEGLMLKHKDSAYTAGRTRGVWWKHKIAPMTLDAVLIYAQAGSGRRANLFTDYTFALRQDGEWVSFAKAYSGLTDDELQELDGWIRRHTVEKHGPIRVLEPVQVFELAFEGISRSTRHKSGLAVRFPRIVRWRKDKLAADADTVESALGLLRG